jgi:regulator of sigma E protease
MSVIIFLLVLFVLILVHEWGHYITAKKTGMRVDEFGIGFPPKLFGIRKGETEYTFNALPIGGFVRIYGEDPTQVEDLDRDRSFGARPKWAQAIVLVAGVTMNMLFAWLLLVTTFMIGIPTAVEEAEAGPGAQLLVQSVLSDGPAAALPPGTFVTTISNDTDTVTDPTLSEFQEFVATNPDVSLTVQYETGDQVGSVAITPMTGVIPDNPEQPAVGVVLAMVETVSYGLIESLERGTARTVEQTAAIFTGLTSLISQSIMGTADYTQVAGPVGIVSLIGDAASYGIVALLTFTAVISINLAIINLLPIPALDGGRLVFVAIEAITGRTIAPIWTARVNLVGFILLMLLMVAVTYNDILRLLG